MGGASFNLKRIRSASSTVINIVMLKRCLIDSRLATRTFSTQTRRLAARPPPLSRAGPPPLPAEDQKEFEELIKKAARPAAQSIEQGGSLAASPLNVDEEMHPDARREPEPEFTGDVNPMTGEKGGPKREPVRPNSDWSFSGRVTDF